MLPSRLVETMRALSFPLRPPSESLVRLATRIAALLGGATGATALALTGASDTSAMLQRAARRPFDEKCTWAMSRLPVDAEGPADRRLELGDVTPGCER